MFQRETADFAVFPNDRIFRLLSNRDQTTMQILTEDINLKVLCFCDVQSVLRFSQVSKYFHSLAFTKQIWKIIVDRLYSGNFISRIPGGDPSSLSTEELVDLVKCTVLGPKSWRSTSGPVVSHQVRFETPPTKRRLFHVYSKAKPKLLPGGRYVLYLNALSLRCQDLQSKQCIWTYNIRGDDYSAIKFDFEQMGREDKVRIIIGFQIYSYEWNNFVEIVDLDLHSGRSISLYYTRVQDAEFDNMLYLPVIRGDYAAVHIGASRLLVIRISTQDSRLYDTDNNICDMSIIATSPPCLILSIDTQTMRSVTQVTTYCLDSMFAHRPSLDSSGIRLLRDEPVLAADTAVFSHGLLLQKLSVLKDPISDSFTIWLALDSGVTSMIKYRFSRTGPNAHLHRQFLRHTSISEFGNPQLADITYFGYLLVSRHASGTIDIVPIVQDGPIESAGAISDMEEDGHDHIFQQHVSPYSGAFTYLTYGAIVVKFYD